MGYGNGSHEHCSVVFTNPADIRCMYVVVQAEKESEDVSFSKFLKIQDRLWYDPTLTYINLH